MKKLFIGLFLSITVHSLLLLEFNLSPIGTNLPKGRTIIGKVKLISASEPKIKNLKTLKTVKKKIKKDSKNLTSLKEKIATSSSKNVNSAYLSYIKILIEQNKEYPFSARKMGVVGVNEVKLLIARDGSFEFKILKKSKSRILDQATKDIFIKIGNFKPLPDGMNVDGMNVLELDIPLKYQLD